MRKIAIYRTPDACSRGQFTSKLNQGMRYLRGIVLLNLFDSSSFGLKMAA